MTTIPSRTMTQTEAIAHAGLETRNGDTVLVVCPTAADARSAYAVFAEALAGPPCPHALRPTLSDGDRGLVDDATGGRILFAWPGGFDLVGDSAYLLGYRDWPRNLDLELMGMWMNSRTRVVTVVETAAAEVPLSRTAAGPWASALDHRMARQLDEQNHLLKLLASEVERFRAQTATASAADGAATFSAGAEFSEPEPWEGHDDPEGTLFVADVDHADGDHRQVGPFTTRKAAWEYIYADRGDGEAHVFPIQPPPDGVPVVVFVQSVQ